MFSKLATLFAFGLSISQGVFASPVTGRAPTSPNLAIRGSQIFDNWGGHESLRDFDSFFGRDNFSGRKNSQIILFQNELVCRRQSARIIQQQLAVVQELAKRIISEQVCEVESQVIFLEQFHSGIGGFRDDLRRHNGRRPAFDTIIANHAQRMFNPDGSFNTQDFGFGGQDVGRNSIIFGGTNWNDGTSPESVRLAALLAQNNVEIIPL